MIMAKRQHEYLSEARRPPQGRSASLALAVLLVTAVSATGCTPTVRVAADDPITINLNVHIQHDIRVRVERELDDLFSDSGVF